MRFRRHPILVFATLLSALPIPALSQSPVSSASTPVGPQIAARDDYFLGETPLLRVTGLRSGEAVTIHLLRNIVRWLPDGHGGWQRTPTPMQGWGAFTADASGNIDLETAGPSAGTTLTPGPVSLFWSARRATDPLLAEAAFAAEGVSLEDDGTYVMRVMRGREIAAERRFRINRERPNMTRVEIITPELVGVFAAPAGAHKLPTIIHLHGSEGGSIAKSRDIAQRYAEQGFATLAIAYFAWPYEARGLPLPQDHRNVPVELLQRARDWLARRPEADARRVALVGNSKGGEFAMLGAATYPWVRAAVGCVPSDIVWEGYGTVTFKGGVPQNIPPAGTYSSWSRNGRSVPYLPTYPERESGFVDNTDRYDRARAEFESAARAARIPIEQTRARLFLIGGDRDRTWASGAMVRSLANAMDAAGRGGQVTSFVSPVGGHFLCGDGQYPHRAWQEDSSSAFAPDIDGQGAAEYAAYVTKLSFLRTTLR